MTASRALFATCLLAVPIVLRAEEPLRCGTTPSVLRRDAAVARWTAEHAPREKALGTAIRDNIVLLPADARNAPFRRPLDVGERTLRFTPNGTDGYSETTEPLAYDSAVGTSLALNPEGVTPYTLTQFAFPFRGESVHALYISQDNAIHLDAAPELVSEQLGALELASLRNATISPALTTAANRPGSPAVFVKETADALTVTWRVDRGRYTYDVQAVLARSGAIAFSYKNISGLRTAGAVITPGLDAWAARQLLGSATDAADADNGMLDLRDVNVSRVSGTNLIELRATLAQPLEVSKLGTDVSVRVEIGVPAAGNLIEYDLPAGGDRTYFVPGWGGLTESPAARIDGNDVVLYVLQDYLSGPLTNVQVRFTTSLGNTPLDSATLKATFERPTQTLQSDLTAAGNASLRVPVLEAFTLPVLSVGASWDELRTAYGLRDDQFDGVAFYQNFYTDIITYAQAYSTSGNAQASGVIYGGEQHGVGTAFPRRPALMHMNKVRYGSNAIPPSASHVILHELGHRWLLFTRILENGARSNVLNPESAHPAQYVHTPAAFNVYTDADESVMGGSFWTDLGNGSFRSGRNAFNGYSWLDLYFMGLASPSEVAPFFYIANSSPALGKSYYAPADKTYSGTRRDVTFQQVVDAMGPRLPAYPQTQRQFRVLFVLIHDPDREITAEELADVQSYRSLLENDFRTATGGRASVITTFELPATGPRRRSVRH
ncbi:MAG TPA: hypothetical protein VF824_11230 [Thermoanaerobaculia bacterium]|jgi:hypothetical protein